MPSNGGGYPPVPPRRDRFHNSPVVRRQQQILFQQQHHQMMQSQLFQQQRRMPRRGYNGDDSSSSSSSSSSVVALYPQRSVSNLDRFTESVSPYVQARFSAEVNATGHRTCEVDPFPFFYLEDLWETFDQWSVCGAGVPLLLRGFDPIDQYFVPFLSGIQLYIDPSKTSSRVRLTNGDSEGDRRTVPIFDLNMQRLNRLSLGDKSDRGSASSQANSPGKLSYQFMELEKPYYRRPLFDKVSILASQCPDLNKCRSSDLLPASWICVAWYPIYRIPMGSTLKDLDASFLSFHYLSTQPRSNSPAKFHAANTRILKGGIIDPVARVSLPVFALASYKLKGSIISPCGPHESEQEYSLMQAADNWLKRMDVKLPDFQFFLSHYPRHR